jgi:hypothetical protein
VVVQVTASLPNVTRDVRWQPVTLVVALPAEPTPRRAAWAEVRWLFEKNNVFCHGLRGTVAIGVLFGSGTACQTYTQNL